MLVGVFVFGSVSVVVYEEEFKVFDVVDEESFVVGGYYVVGFFVGIVVDLVLNCN